MPGKWRTIVLLTSYIDGYVSMFFGIVYFLFYNRLAMVRPRTATRVLKVEYNDTDKPSAEVFTQLDGEGYEVTLAKWRYKNIEYIQIIWINKSYICDIISLRV